MENKNQNQKQGPVKGVFIAAKEIKNEGTIGSEGDNMSTVVITESYEGKGKVYAKDAARKKARWYKDVAIVIGLLGIAATIIVAWL